MKDCKLKIVNWIKIGIWKFTSFVKYKVNNNSISVLFEEFVCSILMCCRGNNKQWMNEWTNEWRLKSLAWPLDLSCFCFFFVIFVYDSIDEDCFVGLMVRWWGIYWWTWIRKKKKKIITSKITSFVDSIRSHTHPSIHLSLNFPTIHPLHPSIFISTYLYSSIHLFIHSYSETIFALFNISTKESA